MFKNILFQSPRSGQICSNITKKVNGEEIIVAFQSPRSGQICSNELINEEKIVGEIYCFNPLDRVKFVQMNSTAKQP